ncbi:membrane protein [Terrihabitans soli]|uniref:Membrane protein n=1 Tax=Terrihabitans soli TaxID=708113 RepID=A0A6S6QRL9_9HYPH|nr:RDD family protein [Terrihabitans soli]BCJ90597.1 membrane protein [Terrihabitans soli]
MTADDRSFPVYHPAALDGVRRKRMIAFLIDFTLVCILWLIACVIVGILGVVTLGLAWLLYGAVFPIVAILYSGVSIGSRGATPGMRAMGLIFRLDTGEQPNFWQGAFHVILFYVITSFTGGLALLISLFNSRKRLLHDMLIGATVENA